jgi:hypothetical protein
VNVEAAGGVEIVSTLMVSIAVAVASRGLWVLALWLRLRAQDRRDEARARYLTAALALPPDRDLTEIRADGTQLHITRTNAGKGRDRG